MSLILNLETVQLVGMTEDNELPLFFWTQPRFDYFLFHRSDSTHFSAAKFL